MTGNGWLDLAMAFVLFLASRSLPARPAVRRRLVAALGEAGYLVLYLTVSLLALTWLIVAAGRAPYLEVWAFAPCQLWVPNLAMPVCCLLVAFGIAAPNPLSFGGRAPQRFDPDKPGIAGFTRHPLLWALALWSASHLAPNGDLAHVLLFGGFALFAVLGTRSTGASSEVSVMPNGSGSHGEPRSCHSLALASGRWRPSGVGVNAEFLVRLLGGSGAPARLH